MTETYDKLNHWYGWNGGECPVHPETVVECSYMDKRGLLSGVARSFPWDGQTFQGGATDRPCAFRIIKLHVEPKVIWVNEYANYVSAWCTRDDAFQFAGTSAKRIAVRYVEQPL